MSTTNLLYQRQYAITDQIRVVIPTIEEILQDEDAYYRAVRIFTSQPIDYMVPLDDAGIDFTKINDWDLFILLFPSIAGTDTHLIIDGLDFSKFEFMADDETKQIALVDKENDIVFDKVTLRKVAAVLRRIHNLELDNRTPGNDEAKKYMLERARAKLKRKKRRQDDSSLEQLIVALVNTEQFKYDYNGVLGLSIYQFNSSVQQIVNKINYDNRMHGVYAGTVDPKKLSQEDLSWLIHKK